MQPMLLVNPTDIWRPWPWTYYYNSSNLISEVNRKLLSNITNVYIKDYHVIRSAASCRGID